MINNLKEFANKYQNNFFKITYWWYGNQNDYRECEYLSEKEFNNLLDGYDIKNFVMHNNDTCVFEMIDSSTHDCHKVWLELTEQKQDEYNWGCKFDKNDNPIAGKGCHIVYEYWGDWEMDSEAQEELNKLISEDTKDRIYDLELTPFWQWFSIYYSEYLDRKEPFLIELNLCDAFVGFTNEKFNSDNWKEVIVDYLFYITEEEIEKQ